MFRFVTILLVLVACANDLPRVTIEPPMDQDQRMLSAVEQAWNARQDLPHGNMAPVLVTDAEDLEVFHELCRVCGPSNIDSTCQIAYGRYENTNQPYVPHAAGCSAIQDRIYGPLGMFTPSNYWRLVVVAPQRTPAQRLSIVVHEGVHWMGSSVGVGPDSTHSDLRRWCDGTCAPGNVEGDARVLLRQ